MDGEAGWDEGRKGGSVKVSSILCSRMGRDERESEGASATALGVASRGREEAERRERPRRRAQGRRLSRKGVGSHPSYGTHSSHTRDAFAQLPTRTKRRAMHCSAARASCRCSTCRQAPLRRPTRVRGKNRAHATAVVVKSPCARPLQPCMIVRLAAHATRVCNRPTSLLLARSATKSSTQ